MKENSAYQPMSRSRRIIPSVHDASEVVHEADCAELRKLHLANRNQFTTPNRDRDMIERLCFPAPLPTFPRCL